MINLPLLDHADTSDIMCKHCRESQSLDSEATLILTLCRMDEGEEVDDAVCPVCEGSTYVGETISCEICTR